MKTTETTQHTPGPWMAYNADNGRILKHWRIRGDCVRDEPTFAVIDSDGKLSPEYEAANARLIAAAPELLEALSLMYCAGFWSADTLATMPEYQRNAIEAARAAISKAEGVQ